MNSLIFSVTARLIFWGMLVASVIILWRGHNEPGGGFVGGLVAAMAFSIIALANGVSQAQRALRVHPVALAGTGVSLALLSGLPGLIVGEGFLTHQWVALGESLKLGTTLIFDIGVYCTVMGGMLCMVFRLYDHEE